MPRWNNNLETNCKEVMDNTIKNLDINLYNELLLTVLNAGVENNKKIIEVFLRQKLNLFSKVSKHTKDYWLARGWSDIESYVKSKENKQENCKSVYSQQTWLEKINPKTNINYTIEEAEFERNSRRPIKKEYWIKQGYTESEAITLAINTKHKNNTKGAAYSAISNIRKVSSKRCTEYYSARGFSDKDAKLQVSNNQKYFSKKICIEKYGEDEGIRVWQKRQDDRQNNLNSKSPEEKARINRLKLSKGISVSIAERIILEKIKEIMPDCTHQFTLIYSNKKQYVYDIMYNNKIIEYNGDFWHSNPTMYPPEYVNPRTKLKAIDKWTIDHNKLQHARDQGYDVLVVWENDFKKNKEKVIKQCIQFLTQ